MVVLTHPNGRALQLVSKLLEIKPRHVYGLGKPLHALLFKGGCVAYCGACELWHVLWVSPTLLCAIEGRLFYSSLLES